MICAEHLFGGEMMIVRWFRRRRIILVDNQLLTVRNGAVVLRRLRLRLRPPLPRRWRSDNHSPPPRDSQKPYILAIEQPIDLSICVLLRKHSSCRRKAVSPLWKRRRQFGFSASFFFSCDFPCFDKWKWRSREVDIHSGNRVPPSKMICDVMGLIEKDPNPIVGFYWATLLWIYCISKEIVRL